MFFVTRTLRNCTTPSGLFNNRAIQSKPLSTNIYKHVNLNEKSAGQVKVCHQICLDNTTLNGKRQFSRTIQVFSEAAAKKEKPHISVLGKLRKQTGYSLSLCKKALENCDQDVEKAKAWLEEQAQAQGWNKANKLEGRNTSQGLIGVCLSSDERTATIVELNSETDFVARNKQFHGLLNQAISTILEMASKDTELKHKDSKDALIVQNLDKDSLSAIPTSEDQNKTLADLVALNIGQIGENLVLNRAATFSTNIPNKFPNGEELKLAVVTHPSGNPSSDTNNVAYGRFGVIMAYSKDENVGILPEGQTVASMARQLCQHIIGMNPSLVGNLDDPATWPTSKQDKIVMDIKNDSDKEEGIKDDENWEHLGEAKNEDRLSKELIHQSFLLNSEILVRDLLLQTGLKVKSFVRFELGEQNS